ncbi:hypothetical protein JX266_014299 [Neoarthrinium moseri]|nr:hypothetical protein JX266_014299 [Neoarthrinium moseri]
MPPVDHTHTHGTRRRHPLLSLHEPPFCRPPILPIELLGSNIAPTTYHVSALAASATPNPRAGGDGRSRRAVGASNYMVEESQGQGQGRAGHTSSEPASATSEKHPAPGSSSANHDAASKRRRGLGIVQVAKCRLRYEIPVRQSKENLRSEIEQQHQSDSVIEALEAGAVGGDMLGGVIPPGSSAVPIYPRAPQLAQKHEYDQNNVWEFSSHRQTQSTRNDFHPDFMQWTAELPRQNRADHGAANLVNQRDYRQCLGTPPARIVLLLGVPDFCLAQQRILREGFPHSRPRYCSQILVSALLVLGCGFSNKPNIWANVNDQSTLVDHFFKETLRLFYREINNHTLTTIQAFSCMFLRDASCGRGTES